MAVEAPRIILAPPVLKVAVDPGVSFANPVVLRIAFAAAALSVLLDSTPFIGFLFVIWSMGAGFLAVWMYRKRTGRRLSVSSGAKLGWITGVFAFAMMTVMVTITTMLSSAELTEQYHLYQKQMSATWSHDPSYQQMLSTLENPATFATVIFFCIFAVFVLLSLASVAGGALGARFSNKE